MSGLGVKFPKSSRQSRHFERKPHTSALPSIPDVECCLAANDVQAKIAVSGREDKHELGREAAPENSSRRENNLIGNYLFPGGNEKPSALRLAFRHSSARARYALRTPSSLVSLHTSMSSDIAR